MTLFFFTVTRLGFFNSGKLLYSPVHQRYYETVLLFDALSGVEDSIRGIASNPRKIFLFVSKILWMLFSRSGAIQFLSLVASLTSATEASSESTSTQLISADLPHGKVPRLSTKQANVSRVSFFKKITLTKSQLSRKPNRKKRSSVNVFFD